MRKARGARWLGAEQRGWGQGVMLGANQGAGTPLVNAVVAGGSQNSWPGVDTILSPSLSARGEGAARDGGAAGDGGVVGDGDAAIEVEQRDEKLAIKKKYKIKRKQSYLFFSSDPLSFIASLPVPATAASRPA